MQLQFGDWMVFVVFVVDFCPVGHAVVAFEVHQPYLPFFFEPKCCLFMFDFLYDVLMLIFCVLDVFNLYF
jgi:hypothetical protein